jgi:mannose-6-phosphate isomerase
MRAAFQTLGEAAAELGGWLREAALPLWTTAGWDAATASFHEALTVEGEPVAGPRRARVQARQIWVCATAAQAGLGDAHGRIARQAHAAFRDRYRRPDGLFAFSATPAGRIADETAALYEQAFVLLALSALHVLDPQAGHDASAGALCASLERLRHPAGGWREAGDRPFQANAHMHLLEAALAWEATGAAGWSAMSDEVAGLALARFVEPRSAVLREFFDERWRALDEAEGQLIEPGHQFEWATLLDRWAQLRGREDIQALARRLYATGLRGVDACGVAVNALSAELGVKDAGARAWAQTEHLKAAVLLGGEAEAVRAAWGLRRYLDTPRPGTWRDRFGADGAVVAQPAPATSLYHLTGAILTLEARAARG